MVLCVASVVVAVVAEAGVVAVLVTVQLLVAVVVVLVAVLLFVAVVVDGCCWLLDVMMCCDAYALRCSAGCSRISLGTQITIWRALRFGKKKTGKSKISKTPFGTFDVCAE